MPSTLENFLMSECICTTSSLVGAIMSPIGPSPGTTGGWSLTCLSIGRTKARVLPDPVFAIPIQSRPLIMTGNACACIGIGFSKPSFLMVSRSLLVSPLCIHVFIGLGTSFPCTLSSSSFL
uniref:DEAD box RNA helicase, putative n=1 Tax=Arundo donax TaxID=35708 RepID=A0A0A9GI28_ARUDO